jgi:DNA-binding response OmpR family regulator
VPLKTTTILLVEDTVELAQVVIRELRANQYRVLHATDGLTALRFHEEEQPDIVILDWMLPELDGLEVLRRLRRVSATPVLMLTARGEEFDRVLGLELGADDYLTKPFSLRELIARVHVLVRRLEYIQTIVATDRQGSAEVVRYGPLELDPQAHTASIDERELKLTLTEFEILHLLIRSPGRTFSRAYLQQTVWNESYLESDRSVDNAILRLRKKLGSVGDNIETVRGVGYRLHREKG